MAINFIKILSDGPEVSFNGSPTVSPMTVDLCSYDPFYTMTVYPYSFFIFIKPFSIYFLALSQAPPELAEAVAIETAETKAPGKRPAMA